MLLYWVEYGPLILILTLLNDYLKNSRKAESVLNGTVVTSFPCFKKTSTTPKPVKHLSWCLSKQPIPFWSRPHSPFHSPRWKESLPLSASITQGISSLEISLFFTVSAHYIYSKPLDSRGQALFFFVQHSEHRASLVARKWRIHLLMQEMQVPSLGQGDPLEKEMAAHSSILA